MIRCRSCVMPNSRPDVYFDASGQCAACINYANRPTIDWEARKKALIELLDRHHGEVLVPSSGGKDSTYQVLTLLELGAHVTVVTARTCHLTPIGRANIDNLARYAKTIEVVPNMTVRAKLNRLGLELVGDISWPEHAAIFSTPFKVASAQRIPLIFYGESPQREYGGPMGSEEAKQMTARWRHEFGGFLGLRAEDFVGKESITDRQMDDYRLTCADNTHEVEAHFLGQYIPWNSRENAKVAIEHGMEHELPTQANWWDFENLDNAQTGIHDFFMWRKYAYGRGCTQISVDVRSGRLRREEALKWVKKWDGHFPHFYMGIPIEVTLDRIEIKAPQFRKIVDQFTNRDLHPALYAG